MSETAAYRWGHLDASSVQHWADLSNLLARVDDTQEYVQAEDLAEELSSASLDPEADTWAIWHGDDLVGYGYLLVPMSPSHEGVARMFLLGGIHPEHRRRGLGRALLERQQNRGLVVATRRHPGLPSRWLTEGGVEGADARGLLSASGYEVVRYFLRMVRSLPGEPITTTADLGGSPRLKTPGPSDSEALRAAHNDAFRDHWGAGEKPQAVWEEERSSRWSRPAFDSMLVDETGAVTSYVLCAEWMPRELYIDAVGTVRHARGQGQARACLERTIALAAASGSYDLVELGVDSNSPTGATRLYEATGFTRDKVFASMAKSGPDLKQTATAGT